MAQQFLSFNDSIGGHADLGLRQEDDERVAEAMREPMRLRDTWVLWEQVVAEDTKSKSYSDAMRKVTKFNTVQEFWQIWNGIPQPSELLEQRRIERQQANGRSVGIDAIMIFKDGIAPEWEDKVNATGGHLQLQLKPNVGGGQIDEYWNNLVIGMIGGTLDQSDMITGVRLVDKMGGSKMAGAIRIELWFARFKDTSAVDALKKNFDRCLGMRLDGSQNYNLPKPDMKAHTSLSKH